MFNFFKIKDKHNFHNLVLESYEQPHRYYHDISHIKNMLIELFELEIELNQHESEVLILAIFFHDIVYKPTQIDAQNILQSIIFFDDIINKFTIGKYLKEQSPQIIPLVRHLISSTNGHNHNNTYLVDYIEGFNLGISKLNSLFLDLDLSILASEKYPEYAANIRKEYEHVSEAEYRTARIELLRGFIQKAKNNQLFKVLINKNAPAVANLQWEITQLESPI